MFVTLQEWIVADGQLPAPRAGTTLLNTGLRASCFDLRASTVTTEQVRSLTPAEARGHPYACEIVGLAGVARDFFVDIGGGRSRRVGAEFSLDMNTFRVLATTTLSEQAVIAGSRVAARCDLSVVADYEWEGFDLPDVRRDWVITGIAQVVADEYVLELELPSVS